MSDYKNKPFRPIDAFKTVARDFAILAVGIVVLPAALGVATWVASRTARHWRDTYEERRDG